MFRTGRLILLALVAGLFLVAAPAVASAQVADTGFSVSNPKFKDYYDHRGGARVFGQPVSREFDFLGTRVQFFQRAVLQLQPNGSVGILNVLDEGLLPFNRINGSTFPGINPSLVAAAPSPSDPAFAAKALDFIRANAPDEFEGLRTNFYGTFINTVSYQEAFPQGEVDPGLMPLINLEVWGLPTSRPTYDPTNGNFVYQRFQRGIMHFDRTTGATQGILIADYLKSLITGQNLPPDLEQDARGSRLYRQYNNGVVNGVARPAELPGTNLFAAFERDGVVVPAPQAAPAPAPTAAPAPAPAGPPPAIIVTGSPWFVEQVNTALNLLSTNAVDHFGNVRRDVFRIEETAGSPSIDFANKTLRINETTAFAPGWRSFRDNQVQWLAGLIVHNAVHIEQAARGSPTAGLDAEYEARTRQKDALARVETMRPGGQFYNYLTDVLNGKEGFFGDWEQPRDPEPGTTNE